MENQDEQEWTDLWESLESGPEGARMADRCAWSALDKRAPSTPKKLDRLWITMEGLMVIWLPLPWAMFFLHADRQEMGEGMGMWGLSWSSAMLDTLVFSALFYAVAYLAWSASKTSWRARWAGPKECLDAKSVAERSEAAAKWLGQAGKRGARCSDVEMMSWMLDKKMDQGMQRNLARDRAIHNESAQAAFKEINMEMLGAMRERSELTKEIDCPAREAKSSKTPRL